MHTLEEIRSTGSWGPWRIVPFQPTLSEEDAALLAVQSVREVREELWGERKGPRADKPPVTPSFHPGRKIVFKKDVAREHIVVMWPSLALSDRRSTAAALLGAVLGCGSSGGAEASDTGDVAELMPGVAASALPYEPLLDSRSAI